MQSNLFYWPYKISEMVLWSPTLCLFYNEQNTYVHTNIWNSWVIPLLLRRPE